MTRVKAIALYERIDSNLDYLEKINTHIVEGLSKWRYKAWMGGSVDPKFCKFLYCKQKQYLKIGDKVLISLLRIITQMDITPNNR